MQYFYMDSPETKMMRGNFDNTMEVEKDLQDRGIKHRVPVFMMVSAMGFVYYSTVRISSPQFPSWIGGLQGWRACF